MNIEHFGKIKYEILSKYSDNETNIDVVKCETSHEINLVIMDMDMDMDKGLMEDMGKIEGFVCYNDVDRVSLDHNYSERPYWMAKKTSRKRKDVERLSYEKPYYCIVCRRPFKHIGIELSNVVCSKNCLDKND